MANEAEADGLCRQWICKSSRLSLYKAASGPKAKKPRPKCPTARSSTECRPAICLLNTWYRSEAACSVQGQTRPFTARTALSREMRPRLVNMSSKRSSCALYTRVKDVALLLNARSSRAASVSDVCTGGADVYCCMFSCEAFAKLRFRDLALFKVFSRSIRRRVVNVMTVQADVSTARSASTGFGEQQLATASFLAFMFFFRQQTFFTVGLSSWALHGQGTL